VALAGPTSQLGSELQSEPTVADLLGALEPKLSACLGPSTTAALRARAESLPLAPFRVIGLELPLAEPEAPADLLLGLAPGVALRGLAGSIDGGAHLTGLIAALADPRHERFGELRDAWLEFDVGSGDGRVPSLFAAPERQTLAGPLAQFLGATPSAQAGVEEVVQGLGDTAKVAQIGVMHGRESAELRCHLTSRQLDEAPPIGDLTRLGWQCDLPAIKAILARYGPLAEWQSMGIGIGHDGELLPAAGLELGHFGGGPEPFLRRLEQDGLAATDTISRLLDWRGHLIDPPGVLPPAFQALTGLTRGRLVSAVTRRINHVKFTIRPGQAPTAKAYFGSQLLLVR